MKTNNQEINPKQEKRDNKGKPRGQKDRQGVLHAKEVSFYKKKDALQEELQSFMYSQSSKLSSVSRNLIFGILGTIWVITFAGGKLTVPNPQLFYALLISFLFMVIDVLHYLTDSISYHRQQYKLESYKTQEDLTNIYDKEMDRINKRSHNFIIGKTVILLFASIMFAWGIVDLIPSVTDLINGI